MKDMADSFALQAGQSFTRQQAIDWFAEHYPKIRPGTVHCHLIRLSTNAPTCLHYNAKPHEDDVFFQLDGGHFRLYDPAHDPAPIYEGSAIPKGKPAIENDTEPECSTEFAYEADLRNYLAKNLLTFGDPPALSRGGRLPERCALVTGYLARRAGNGSAPRPREGDGAAVAAVGSGAASPWLCGLKAYSR
jgi:hypothetical protein